VRLPRGACSPTRSGLGASAACRFENLAMLFDQPGPDTPADSCSQPWLS
jgi:hypothetical protein